MEPLAYVDSYDGYHKVFLRDYSRSEQVMILCPTEHVAKRVASALDLANNLEWLQMGIIRVLESCKENDQLKVDHGQIPEGASP